MSTNVAQKFREQFLAAVTLNLANDGNPDMMWEFIGQMIASYVMSGEPTALEVATVYEAITQKVAAMIDEPGSIWPELMPGPVRDDEHHEYLMFKVGSMMTENVSIDLKGMVRYRDLKVERLHKDENGRVEVYGKDLEGNECWILLHTTPVLNEVLHDMTKKPGNIVLDYEVALHRDEDDGAVRMLADRAEFFLDEHGIQWVKFVAKNGYESGHEMMWRTDRDGFAVSRR